MPILAPERKSDNKFVRALRKIGTENTNATDLAMPMGVGGVIGKPMEGVVKRSVEKVSKMGKEELLGVISRFRASAERFDKSGDKAKADFARKVISDTEEKLKALVGNE